MNAFYANFAVSRSLLRSLFYLALVLGLFLLPGCARDHAPALVDITAQPVDQTVVVGETGTFTVVATGVTSYQWQESTNGGTTFTDIANATTASFTTAITTLSDSGTQYRVVVTGDVDSQTSSAVTLTVSIAPVAPSISVHPSDQTKIAGQDASFSVTADGTTLSYQWQRSTNGGTTFVDIAGATNSTLSLSAVDEGENGQQFRVLVSNSAASVTSNTATLSVNPAPAAPTFIQQPGNSSTADGQDTLFVVTVSGTPMPTLQWQISTDNGVTWGDISGETTNTLNILAAALADTGQQFRAVASNSEGVVNSDAAIMTVFAAPAIPAFITQPVDMSVTEGNNAQFTVVVSGIPTPTLQWQLSTDNGASWSNITNATSATLDVVGPTIANNGRQFRAVASNSAGVVNSNVATLSVNAAITVAAPLALGKIAAEQFHTCAVKADDTLACWGHNTSGEVVPGTFNDSNPEPIDVSGLTAVTQVAVGYQETCAIADLGKLYCWGGSITTPTTVKIGGINDYEGVKGVAMGLLHRCFIDSNTTVHCWGDNSLGQLGQGNESTDYVADPVLVARYQGVLTGVVSLVAGDYHTCALMETGDVVCWGHGPVGTGDQSALIAAAPAVTGAIALGSGTSHVCAAMAVGGMKCWGKNGYGQLGNRNTTDSWTPVDVYNLSGYLSGVTLIAGEAKNTCAVPATGRLVCWGAVMPDALNGTNTYGPTQKGSLNTGTTITALVSGWQHACALISDGTMECWGTDQYGQLGNGAGLVAINLGGPFPNNGTRVVGDAIFWK